MADPAPAAASDSKGPSPLIVAIAVAVLMLVGTGAIVYFVLPGILEASFKKALASQPGAAAGDDSAAAAPAAEGAKGAEGKPGEAKGSDNFQIQDILVNIAGTKAGRFLKATAYFEAPPSVVAELENKRAKITDIVSATLGQKSLDELSDPGIRGRLRSELLATINPLLETKGEVTNIYFPQFIIQ